MKKKNASVPKDNEYITKAYFDKQLAYRFGRFRKSFGEEIRREIKEESHRLEFRLVQRMDQRFEEVNRILEAQNNKIDAQTNKMTAAIDTFQRLADKVIGAHNNFEVESLSIKNNYHRLDERLTKVEKVVFPEQV